jgi:hypothetical protein
MAHAGDHAAQAVEPDIIEAGIPAQGSDLPAHRFLFSAE